MASGAAEERRRWKMQSERDEAAEGEAEAEAACRAAGFWEEEPGRVPIPEVTPDVEIFSPPAIVQDSNDVIDLISDDEDGVKAPTWRQVRGHVCICLVSCSTVCTRTCMRLGCKHCHYGSPINHAVGVS